MNNPLVSIIIPTFNRAHLIGETLDSIMTQTYENWECIVVDDGSNDNTDEIVNDYIKRDNRFQFYKRPNDRLKGANACRNYGFEKSKGEYVNWVDSDDLFTVDHLEKHLENFSKSSIVKVSISLANTFIDHPSNVVREWSNIIPKSDIVYEMIVDEVLWAIGAVVWKMEVINKKPFNEILSSSQEWVFHLNQLIKGVQPTPLKEVTFLVRDHSGRIGKDYSEKKSFSMFESRKLIWKSLLQNDSLTLEMEKGLLVVMFSSLRASIANKYYKLLFKNSIYLLTHILKFKYRFKILKVVFVSVPVYLVFGKGERLFKWN